MHCALKLGRIVKCGRLFSMKYDQTGLFTQCEKSCSSETSNRTSTDDRSGKSTPEGGVGDQIDMRHFTVERYCPPSDQRNRVLRFSGWSVGLNRSVIEGLIRPEPSLISTSCRCFPSAVLLAGASKRVDAAHMHELGLDAKSIGCIGLHRSGNPAGHSEKNGHAGQIAGCQPRLCRETSPRQPIGGRASWSRSAAFASTARSSV